MHHTISLKLNHVFRRLYAKGDHTVGSYLVVYCRRNGLGFNRLGVTASTKLGHAVVRNRARRRLRELYRLNEHRLKPGYDIVLVARSRAVTGNFAAMESAFLHQCRQLKLLAEDPA